MSTFDIYDHLMVHSHISGISVGKVNVSYKCSHYMSSDNQVVYVAWHHILPKIFFCVVVSSDKLSSPTSKS